MAVVERLDQVGDNCTHRGTIPSKALRQAVKQMLQQEYGSNQAREGAARDHLNALIKDTAPCSGELTALWVYLTAKDAFGYNVFKSFTSSHGTNAEQRRRALPYFLRWIPDFTEQEAPSRL